jgi:hypothetical protein
MESNAASGLLQFFNAYRTKINPIAQLHQPPTPSRTSQQPSRQSYSQPNTYCNPLAIKTPSIIHRNKKGIEQQINSPFLGQMLISAIFNPRVPYIFKSLSTTPPFSRGCIAHVPIGCHDVMTILRTYSSNSSLYSISPTTSLSSCSPSVNSLGTCRRAAEFAANGTTQPARRGMRDGDA